MTRGHRLAMTAEEGNFQVWLEKNWDRPLSDEVERLQDELKRLSPCLPPIAVGFEGPSQNGGDCSAKGFWRVWVVALLLWYMNNYSETRAALREVCALVAAKIKADAGGMTAEELKEVTSLCDDKAAL